MDYGFLRALNYAVPVLMVTPVYAVVQFVPVHFWMDTGSAFMVKSDFQT